MRVVFTGLMLLTAPLALADDPKPVRVLIETPNGDTEVELDAAKAPNTVANFRVSRLK
jgi:hypothetical protein